MHSSTRFYALDALRGLAIALMILVNTPGSWQHVYRPLLHAQWDGFTFADIVFPAFLFVVGAAMFYSLRHAELNAATLARIAKRSALLNWFPFTAVLAELRIVGVLQRIALCYAVAAVLVLAGYYVAAQLKLRSAQAGAVWLLNAAALLLPAAWLCSVFWPVNKALWSGSYVLLSVGILLLILAALVWLCDVRQQRGLLQPLIVYGSNPLFIYILAWLWAVSAALIPLGGSNLYQYCFELLALLLAPKAASLLFALLHVLLFWWLSLLLYRRHIIIKL